MYVSLTRLISELDKKTRIILLAQGEGVLQYQGRYDLQFKLYRQTLKRKISQKRRNLLHKQQQS